MTETPLHPDAAYYWRMRHYTTVGTFTRAEVETIARDVKLGIISLAEARTVMFGV